MSQFGATPSGRVDSAPQSREKPGYPPRLVTVSIITAGWGLLYALYRGYYGFGGTAGMIGRPASDAQFRAINLAGAAILLIAAILPAAVLPLWRRPRLRRFLLALCWVLAVFFVMHALTQDIQRVLSLTGVRRMSYPASQWVTVNRHAADIQDLAFNETWFLAEGVLWWLLACLALGRTPARSWWSVTALAAVAAMTAIGMLSAFGVIGKFVVA